MSLLEALSKLTLREFDQEVNLTLKHLDVPFTRQESGSVIQYSIFCDSDNVEIGRLIIAPRLPDAPEAPGVIYEDQVASPQDHKRCQQFRAILQRIEDDIDFHYGFGEWAAAWEKIRAKAATKSPQVSAKPMLTEEEGMWGKQGRPGLSLEYKEYIYRLAKAQEGEEIKARDPQKPWKAIAVEIGWARGGTKESAIKLLADARKRLERASAKDLEEVAMYRAQRE